MVSAPTRSSGPEKNRTSARANATAPSAGPGKSRTGANARTSATAPSIESTAPETTGTQSMLSMLVRISWLGFAYIPLLYFASVIIAPRDGFASLADLGYWVTVGSVMVLRFLDFRYFHRLNADNSPSTPRDVKRFTIVLCLVCAAIWGLLHLVSFVR
jgi:hypothetical protein